jgi:hypothetical protein
MRSRKATSLDMASASASMVRGSPKLPERISGDANITCANSSVSAAST